MNSSAPRPPSDHGWGPTRPGGRRSALDRLAVSADTAVLDNTVLDSTVPDNTILDTVGEGTAIAAPTTGHQSGWGVTAMPTWLTPDGDDSPSYTRDPVNADPHEDDRRDDDLHDDDLHDDEFPRRRTVMAPPAALVIIAIGVLACAFAGYSLLRDRSIPTDPVAFPISAGPTAPRAVVPSAGPPSSSPAAPASAAPAELVVSVVGLVRRPGLVRLRPQARVADAIEHAGGARAGADLLSLNMAQPLRDGDQVLVGYAGDGGRMSMRSNVVSSADAGSAPPGGNGTAGSGAPGSTAAGAPAAAGGKVDLNTATEAQLDALPGVGPVTAKAIVAWRTQNGRFASVEQLGEVDGIGPAKLARLRDLVTV